MSPSKDDPPSAPKIAIKGFSLSAKPTPKPGNTPASKPKPTPSSSLGKRPRSTFHHDDSDSDSDGERRTKHEVVTSFGEEGAIKYDEKRKEGPLIIPRLGNRDWRGSAGRGKGKNLLPAEVQAQRAEKEREVGGGKREGVDVVNGGDGEVKWGLCVRMKEEKEEEVKVEVDVKESVKVEQEQEAKPKSADDEALQALLGNDKERKGPSLIIPAHETEEAAYRHAIATAPPPSTLEDYERIPVEEFGAALLRGMGWDGEMKRGKVKDVKRRQNLLGLGAKELQGAEELGAWVQKADVKRLKPAGDMGKGERRPKVSEYKREEEKRRERREERGGGSYRRERERERERERDGERDRERDGYRERDSHRDRDRDRERRRH
jgi:G-patch domain